NGDNHTHSRGVARLLFGCFGRSDRSAQRKGRRLVTSSDGAASNRSRLSSPASNSTDTASRRCVNSAGPGQRTPSDIATTHDGAMLVRRAGAQPRDSVGAPSLAADAVTDREAVVWVVVLLRPT